jgi:hypothetical protein
MDTVAWANSMFDTIAWCFFGFVLFFGAAWAIVIGGVQWLLLPASEPTRR